MTFFLNAVHPRERIHRQQPKSEGVWHDREVVQQTALRRIPLRVRGRHLPEALLGRRNDQRVGAGGHRQLWGCLQSILSIPKNQRKRKKMSGNAETRG